MKKILILTVLMLVLSPVFGATFITSIACETNDYATPIYLEIDISHSFEQLSISGEYCIGYDMDSKSAYNSLIIDFGLSFEWGTVYVSKGISSVIGNTTKFGITLSGARH